MIFNIKFYGSGVRFSVWLGDVSIHNDHKMPCGNDEHILRSFYAAFTMFFRLRVLCVTANAVVMVSLPMTAT